MAGKKATVNTYIEADTKHFVSHMKVAEKAVNNTRKAQARMDKQNSFLVKSFSRAASAASVLHGPLNGVSGRLTAMATAMRTTGLAGIGIGAGLTALSVAVVASTRSLAEFEVQMKRVIAVQEATGYASGFTGEQIHQMSQSIAMDTLASVDGVMAAAAALGTFDTIAGETFERTLRLGQDVAEVMGTDMQGATIQLAKALADPVRGLTALTRSGVTFTEETKEQIKAAMEFGDILKAQALILAQVEEQLGGVAKAVADNTLKGGWDSFTQNIQTFIRTNSGAIALIEGLKNAMEKINGFLTGGALGAAAGGGGDLHIYWQQRKDALDEYAEAQGKILFMERDRAGYLENIAKAEKRYQDELRRVKELDAKAEKARIAGEAAQAQAALDAKEAAEKKYRERHRRATEAMNRRLASATASAARTELDPNDIQGTTQKAVAAEEAKMEAKLATQRAAYAKLRDDEKLHTGQLEEWNRTHQATQQAIIEESMLKIQDIKEKGAMMQAEKDGEEVKRKEEAQIRSLTLFAEQMKGYAAMGAAASDTLGQIAGLFEEGSKQQKAFAIASQSAALIQATANVGVAMANALASSKTWYEMPVAIAQAVALGAQAISMVQGARAMGGPVSAGGSYWVGENGPEIVHMNRPGHVTKASEAGRGVTVSLIEDASRAGTQSVDEAGIVQVAVANIRGELQRDIASGRGIFKQAEQQYGLNRTR